MSKRHTIPEQCDLRTPFRDGRGETITIRLSRPSFQSIAFFVVLANLAQTALAQTDKPSERTYLVWYGVCFAVALTSGGLAERMFINERMARVAGAAAGSSGLLIAARSMPPAAELALLITATGIAGTTLAAEVSFRLAARVGRDSSRDAG
jgi:hypothetical protein